MQYRNCIKGSKNAIGLIVLSWLSQGLVLLQYLHVAVDHFQLERERFEDRLHYIPTCITSINLEFMSLVR
jgi:hypothetical protein